MRKTITLLFSLFLVANLAYAQEVIFEDNFASGISAWTLYDEDGDGHNFQGIVYEGGMSALVSYSYHNETFTPLTPDNYAVTPAIDVSDFTALKLAYEVGGQDPSYSAETYTVYVSSGNTVEDFLNEAITISFNESLANDASAHGAQQPRLLEGLEMFDDVDTVYIAFRHHDSSDEFAINFTNVSLTGTDILGTDKHYVEGFAHFVNGKNLTIRAEENISSLNVYNVIGQSIYSSTPNNNLVTATLDNLNKGMYIGEITVEGVKKSFKFVIK